MFFFPLQFVLLQGSFDYLSQAGQVVFEQEISSPLTDTLDSPFSA